MRLPKRVERVAADDRVQRHAGLARAGADLAHELALQRLLVELALAGDHRARGAHAGVEVERVEHPRRARLERAPSAAHSPPDEPAGGAGHRHAARVARAGRAPARPGASPAASTIAGSAPFCGPNTRGASSNGVRTSHSTTSCAPRRPPCVLDRLERARAAVGGGRAADRDEDHLRARLDRGGDQLAGAVGRRRPGVALVLGDQRRARRPPPSRRAPCRRPRPAPKPARSRAAERVVRVAPATSRRRARAAARRACPRRRRRPGTGRAASGRRARARGRSRRHLRRRGTCP